jgi:hypothetical protein
MAVWTILAGGVAAGAGMGLAATLAGARRDARAADRLWAALAAAPPAPADGFDPAMTDGLPEPARRCLCRAIAPGTRLAPVVELAMEGSFLLNGRALPMRSSEILAPGRGFVWKARVGRWPLGFSGSDGWQAGGTSWTRFRLAGLVPLVAEGGSPDHARASAARLALESVWAPMALLPQAGAVWQATGPDQAEVRFPAQPELRPIELRLDGEGRVTEVCTQRWSNANPERAWRWQPFGGRMTAWRSFAGLTVPSEVEIGNHWGTARWAPFFRARITDLYH